LQLYHFAGNSPTVFPVSVQECANVFVNEEIALLTPDLGGEVEHPDVAGFSAEARIYKRKSSSSTKR
jgi:hypothetical protein